MKKEITLGRGQSSNRTKPQASSREGEVWLSIRFWEQRHARFEKFHQAVYTLMISVCIVMISVCIYISTECKTFEIIIRSNLLK